MIFLVQCPECGCIYKCKGVTTVKGLRYITDYNDDITETCVCCKKKITPKAMNTEEWIADLVVKIKGH